MTSFKSKIFNFLIRNRHLFQGKFRKEVFNFNTSIHAFRERCEQGAAKFAKLPASVTVRKQLIANVPCEWLMPENAPENKVILYFHGGGYVSGSCNDHRGIISNFADRAGFTFLIFEYRLAPEHPFPAAIDDSVIVYNWLLSNGYPPDNVLFAGESAGGGLCLATLLAIKEQQRPMPVAAVAISPWTDLTCSGDSYKTKNRVSAAPIDSWTVFSSYYIGDNDAKNPLISPLFGDLRGLPPVFINSAMDDELFDDGESFYKKAMDAGVEIYFKPGEGMVHCYPLLAPMFREATEAINEIVDFVREKLNSN